MKGSTAAHYVMIRIVGRRFGRLAGSAPWRPTSNGVFQPSPLPVSPPVAVFPRCRKISFPERTTASALSPLFHPLVTQPPLRGLMRRAGNRWRANKRVYLLNKAGCRSPDCFLFRARSRLSTITCHGEVWKHLQIVFRSIKLSSIFRSLAHHECKTNVSNFG